MEMGALDVPVLEEEEEEEDDEEEEEEELETTLGVSSGISLVGLFLLRCVAANVDKEDTTAEDDEGGTGESASSASGITVRSDDEAVPVLTSAVSLGLIANTAGEILLLREEDDEDTTAEEEDDDDEEEEEEEEEEETAAAAADDDDDERDDELAEVGGPSIRRRS